jgi:lactate dehydrogenase-like 2-hydroxyacid dehydrogenase
MMGAQILPAGQSSQAGQSPDARYTQGTSDVKPQIMLAEPMMKLVEDQLDELYTVHRLYDPAQKQAIEAALSSIRGVATGGGGGLSNEWIERLPALGVIAVNGVGTDKIDLAFARQHNVDVATTLGVLTDDVADMGIALMLGILRNMPQGDKMVRDGRWAAGDAFPLGISPKGKRVGILGLGQIGKAFAERAEAFGMQVRYWNRSPLTDVAWKSCATPVELAEDSDVLAVCIAASSATQNIVIDEDALLSALNDGKIAGAALDVFVGEPKIREEFYTAPNTVLMPHQGSATWETRIAMGNLVLSNLAAYFAGEKPPTTIN